VNLAERFSATKPEFGLATSPLVVGESVIINPASTTAPRLVALETATGKTRWITESRGTDGYSSPHPAAIDGVDQVLLFDERGLTGHDPASGRELWHYDWTVAQNEPTTVQPLVLPDGRIVIGGGNIGLGIRCVVVRKEGDGWSAKEAWRTTRFTPKFNDIVRSGDYLYGLDGGMLSCLKLSDGQRMWKEGRYGAGQLLLVGDKLIIVSEKGQVACVAAKPNDYEELWRMDAIKGKTWNHPAIARGRLFVRNMGEMVAYDLPGSSGETGGGPSSPTKK
jgi:outer membrane protein assembly factor BamB